LRDDLLLYYRRELDYLRDSAMEFATKHPKVAARLLLEENKCEDPHVERILESFAFLAARIHLKMDDEFPEITEALLTIVYPQLVRPLPSMTVVEFQLDASKGKLTAGLKIDRDTPIESPKVDDKPCTFRTCYDTILWPISVEAAEFRSPSRLQPAVKNSEASWAVRLHLQCASDVTFAGLKLNKLRFYLDGESGLVNTLYELLFGRLKQILIRDLTPGSRQPAISLPASALSAVGFAAEEGMLPYTASTFAGHRLLMEYFAFPEKFLFIDLTGLECLAAAGFKSAIEVIFLISEIEGDGLAQRLELEITTKTFKLGCTPVVNLFPLTTDPIQLTQRKSEYLVTPDLRRPWSTEVFSIDEVCGFDSASQKTTRFEPFYSLRHSASAEDRSCFWLARRRPSTRPNDDGTEVYVSLVDLGMATASPDANSLTLRTTCTNRDLPSRLPFGAQSGDFTIAGVATMKRIIPLRKITPPVRRELGKGALWQLVSHLSLNYLSLVEGGEEALKELLRLYDVGQTAYSQNVIQSIKSIDSKPHFARLISEHGISFARGLRIEMKINEDQLTGGGAFLFCTVLERFFALAASLNSFTQLSVVTPQRKGGLHEWQPRSGRKLLV
jgi:type VI secretion system protein ImpG